MGKVLQPLSEERLPPRSPVASRMMVDLCENIHIHHRELRQEFSIAEFREYTDELARARESVEKYLSDNPEYREGAYPTTVMVANGKARLLVASPKPSKSAYFPERLRIDLEYPTSFGEVHIHWRDWRLFIDREQLRIAARAFAKAIQMLDQYESKQKYPPRRMMTEEDMNVVNSKPPMKAKGKGHFLSLLDRIS
ncbi:MAG: hypothetical protein WDA12_04995 [Bacilli bacterium]